MSQILSSIRVSSNSGFRIQKYFHNFGLKQQQHALNLNMIVLGFSGETWGKETIWKTQALMEEQYSSGSSRCGMDWIDLAQDEDGWRAVMKAVMNIRFP